MLSEFQREDSFRTQRMAEDDKEYERTIRPIMHRIPDGDDLIAKRQAQYEAEREGK